MTLQNNLPAVMQAAFLERPGELKLRTVPVPRPGAGELLLRVEVALTCGTDLKMYRRGHAKLPTPTPFGHELAGTVVAAGTGTRFEAGTAVTSVPTSACGTCSFCLRGRDNLCADATGRMVFGAFAEYVLLPKHIVDRHVFVRPDSLTPESAAMLEPLACVVHGANRLGWRDRMSVVILGDGPIALLFARVAVLRGADVLVVGRHAHRTAVAGEFGARGKAGSVRDVVPRVFPHGADIVVECVGTAEAWREASDTARVGGRVLFFGGCAAGADVSFDAFRIHYEEVDHIGAFHYTTGAVREARELLESGAVDPAPIVTHRRRLDQLHEALALVANRTALKVAVTP